MSWSDRRKRLAAAGGLALAVAAAAALGLWISSPVPEDALEPPATLRFFDVRGELIDSPAGEAMRASHPVPPGAMGRLPEITVLLEDRRFRDHAGVDPLAAAAAAWRNLRAGRVVSGGSTITQQLVKLARGGRPRTFPEKCREAVAALKLDAAAGKEAILAAYLNRLPYGNRLVGPEAAARWYFAKPAARLSLAEAVYLAGIPQAPSRYNPVKRPREAEAKYRRSVERLAACGYLGPGEAAVLRRELPRAGWHLPERRAGHFVGYLMAARPGLRGDVWTTLDLGRQREVEALARMHLAILNRRDVTNAGAVVVENATGAVRAMVGSADPARWQTNIAAVPRAAGSVLKPFVYAEGIERRAFTAASVLPDTAEACLRLFPDYAPRNFSGRWHGPVRAREALGNSLNVPAVVALARAGPRRTFDALRGWGFRFPETFDAYGAGLVLGNGEVRLIDLAGAYAGLARGGLAMDLALLRGEAGAARRMVSRETAALVGDILCDNGARLLSFGPASVLDLGKRVAVKTGTSSHFRDAWTAGYGRRHTVAVWVGNFDGRPMDAMASVDAAAPLWAAVMRRLLPEGEALPELPDGTRLVRAEVDALTGLLPVPGEAGLRRVAEWFLPGSAPEADASGEYARVGGRLVPLLSSDYAAWCGSGFNALGAVARVPAGGAEIESPRDGAVYRIEPFLGERQQMVPLRLLGVAGEVRWKVNGEPVVRAASAAAGGGEIFWPLRPGEWEFEAAFDGGEVRSRVRVE